MQHLSLSQLNGLVSLVFRDEFSDAYWVTAEISEAHGSSGGHFYLELVEMDDRRQVIAKARATIWANTAATLQAKFQRATGERLGAGMKVLFLARLAFHEVYGYSLNIQDIDPAYTIGDQAQRRAEILAQLDEDGVLHMNKELPLPSPLRRIAVVSSATAAGYGDFAHQLANSGFAFDVKLFPATMQGEQTERSVISALESIYAEAERWDAVVIIRGGGATSDLNSFDSYLLAATVAQFPLPIFTGIGHERDKTILDVVAHHYFKTPTAVAAFLIDTFRDATTELERLIEQLEVAVHKRFRYEHQRLESTIRRYQLQSQTYVATQREQLLRLSAKIELRTASVLQAERHRLDSILPQIVRQIAQCIEGGRQRLSLQEKAVAMASPDRILQMGFSITMREGHIVTRAAALRKGDRLTHRFADGEAESIVR